MPVDDPLMTKALGWVSEDIGGIALFGSIFLDIAIGPDQSFFATYCAINYLKLSSRAIGLYSHAYSFPFLTCAACVLAERLRSTHQTSRHRHRWRMAVAARCRFRPQVTVQARLSSCVRVRFPTAQSWIELSKAVPRPARIADSRSSCRPI
eukprot:1470288-Pleurochrysis_carterae.AAC.1